MFLNRMGVLFSSSRGFNSLSCEQVPEPEEMFSFYSIKGFNSLSCEQVPEPCPFCNMKQSVTRVSIRCRASRFLNRGRHQQAAANQFQFAVVRAGS